jgi:hypothetical protein
MALFAASASGKAVANTMTTQLEINPPANRKVVITEMSVTFSGVSATDVPVLVQLCRVTTASAAGTAVTATDQKDSAVGAAATLAKFLPATEGTVVVLKQYEVPPSSGLVIQYPLGREPEVFGAGASAKGYSIRCNRGSGAAINADTNIEFEE